MVGYSWPCAEVLILDRKPNKRMKKGIYVLRRANQLEPQGLLQFFWKN